METLLLDYLVKRNQSQQHARRTMRSQLEDHVNKHLTRATAVQSSSSVPCKIGPSHVLIPWMIRHAAFSVNRFQTRANGKTAYYSMRGKAYNGDVLPFGEIAQFRKITDDKFESRWVKEVWIGKSEERMNISF